MAHSHPQFSQGTRSVWQQRLSDPGWLMLPLRGFLGVTFVYAGLQKFADPAFFDPASPLSIAGQMREFQHSSPIGPLVGLAAHLPTVTGLAIALGEIAVGIGTLIGAFTRVAAAGGLALSTMFFLTVSWTTSPYFYGADIVFAFAWLTLLLAGDHGVCSATGWISGRRPGARDQRPGRIAPEGTSRRAVVRVGSIAAAVGALAAVTAAAGRLFNPAVARAIPMRADAVPSPRITGPTVPDPAVMGPTVTDPPAATRTAPTAAAAPTSAPSASGVPVGAPSSVSVGQAKPFTDPATGDPAWLVHDEAGQFVAFDAVCTHAGCTVDYDPASAEFHCPCHGGRFDARTGGVLQGPPEQPLRQIPVHISGGQLRVDA